MKRFFERIKNYFSGGGPIDDEDYDDYEEDDGSGPVDAIRVASGTGRPESVGMGEDSRVGDGVETSPFVQDLADLRWVAQREALVVASQDLDPELWTDGRMAFDFERVLAHQHEDIRQRLATWVGKQTSDVSVHLAEEAQVVVDSLDDLMEADRDAVLALKEWQRVYDDVQADESDLARYDRIRSKTYKGRKNLIWAGLVAAEASITFLIFRNLIGAEQSSDKAIALLLSVGVVMAMVLVPHYAAIALREGTTRVHRYELEYTRRKGFDPSYELERKVEHEESEDKGSRILAIALAVILLGAVLPLSLIRAHDFKDDRIDHAAVKVQAAQSDLNHATETVNAANSGKIKANADQLAAVTDAQARLDNEQRKLDRAERDNPYLWVLFFVLFQLLISLYFFLREWSDHGVSALHLSQLADIKSEALEVRQHARRQLVQAVADYHRAAESMVYLLRQAPHWDNQIVENYLATVWYFRHVIADAHPDLSEFIHNAVLPSLQTEEDGQRVGSRFVIEPTSWDNAKLDDDSQFARTRWIEDGLGSLTERALPEVEDVDGDQRLAGTWMLTKDPMAFLDVFLGQFGYSAIYRRPPELDQVDYVNHEDPLEMVHLAQFEDWQAEREATKPTFTDPTDPAARTSSDPGDDAEEAGPPATDLTDEAGESAGAETPPDPAPSDYLIDPLGSLPHPVANGSNGSSGSHGSNDSNAEIPAPRGSATDPTLTTG